MLLPCLPVLSPRFYWGKNYYLGKKNIIFSASIHWTETMWGKPHCTATVIKQTRHCKLMVFIMFILHDTEKFLPLHFIDVGFTFIVWCTDLEDTACPDRHISQFYVFRSHETFTWKNIYIFKLFQEYFKAQLRIPNLSSFLSSSLYWYKWWLERRSNS